MDPYYQPDDESACWNCGMLDCDGSCETVEDDSSESQCSNETTEEKESE